MFLPQSIRRVLGWKICSDERVEFVIYGIGGMLLAIILIGIAVMAALVASLYIEILSEDTNVSDTERPSLINAVGVCILGAGLFGIAGLFEATMAFRYLTTKQNPGHVSSRGQ